MQENERFFYFMAQKHNFAEISVPSTNRYTKVE